jgi:hypothetical protein
MKARFPKAPVAIGIAERIMVQLGHAQCFFLTFRVFVSMLPGELNYESPSVTLVLLENSKLNKDCS